MNERVRPIVREYAPGITDPAEFVALVEESIYFTNDFYQTPEGKKLIKTRYGRIKKQLETGASSSQVIAGIETWNEGDLKTAHAVLGEIIYQRELLS